MGRQSSSEKLEIKAEVRKRDGYRCVVCRMRNRTHKERYGKRLEVHRIVPKSNYSVEWGMCVALCNVCHDALHGQGSWGWIAKEDPEDEDQLARWVQQSAERDAEEEREWRRRQGWGAWLREVREKVGGVSQAELALSAGVPEKTLRDWEAGRGEPLFSEAMRLAKAMYITLDGLSSEHDPDDLWLKYARERSAARALAFRARQAGEGEVLGRGATLVRDVVARADQKRQDAREAASKPSPYKKPSFAP